MNLRYGMEIRAATPAEAPGLVTLLAEAGLRAEPRELADRLATLRQGPATALVALQWGPPSGAVLLHWHPTLTGAPVARITLLLVAAEQRRQGIGRLLLKAAAQAARVAGCDRLEIATPPGAADLQGFCMATGFAAAGGSFVRSLRKQN
jgi:aminoglycoside 6'-N-acetyltransferase I